MRYLLTLFLLGLGVPLFDNRKKFNFRYTSDHSIERELSTRKQKLRRRQCKYKKGKRKKRNKFKQKHFALKGTHAKDSRYSNGNKLRRMFINM